MKKLLLFKFSMFTALILSSALVLAQDYETSKTVSKSLAVPNDVKIEMTNHSGDVKFVLSNSNEVSIKTSVNLHVRDESDAKRILEAIDEFEFDLQGSRLEIDTRFYRNMNTINNRSTLTLLNGDKVKLKDFTISHEISIPVNAQIDLENKYSNVSLPDLKGPAKLNLYNSKLNAEDFESSLELEAKYSKLYVSDLKAETQLTLYDTDVEFASAGAMKVESKYSRLEGDKAQSLNINSYDDKILVDELNSLEMEAKYSDLESEAELENIKLNLYDCNLKIASAKDLKFDGKYCELKLGNVKNMVIGQSYDNDLYLKKTHNIRINESKYSSYSMSTNTQFEILGYDDDISIEKLNDDFEGISFDCKYGKLNVISGSASFRVDLMMKYGKVNLPDSLEPSKHIEKNSELEITAGKEGGIILIRGYDNTIQIR
ncbi:hypothetical protein [Maribellus sediminis]|uniref:hypothetical protein n=1 Tax=Maribellus sediminis TaxID=2696285 RepID=UPI001431CD3E|nr:hypothetical protein [Maribellus sediminis]